MPTSITKPVVGGSNGTWGTELNAALDALVSGLNAVENNTSRGGGTGGIPATTVTTKGDLLVATSSGTVTRQAAGTNGYTLTADSSTSTGLAYRLAPGSLVAKWRATSTQSIPANNSAANLISQTADYDRFGTFSGGASTFTPTVAGWYEFTGGVSFNGVTGGYRSVKWTLNGGTIGGGINTVPNNGGNVYETVPARAVVLQLTTSDTVALQAMQSTASAVTTFYGGDHAATFIVKYLGPN